MHRAVPAAARAYFRGLAKLVDPAFAFQGRSKRPPKDPFNSMLSLGYSLLMNVVYGELENKGLNPYFGMMHRDREKHPTLASDLMEEWRAVIVDSTVMSLVNGHEILLEHFVRKEDTPGIFLTKEGIRRFITKMEQKFSTKSRYLEELSYPVSFRRGIGLQIDKLIHAMEEGDTEQYTPIRIR